MPIYRYSCVECGIEGAEHLAKIDSRNPECPKCGKIMNKMPTFPAMVKYKGEGGYPSRKKQIFNTTLRKHPKLT